MWRALIALALTGVVLAGCKKTETRAPQRSGPGRSPAAATAVAAGMPLYDTAEQYSKACGEAIADARTRLLALETLAGAPTVESVLRPLNEVARLTTNGWNEAVVLERAHPDAEFRDAAEACDRDFSALASDIKLSRPLYERVVAVDVSRADKATQYSHFKLLRDFQRAGVDNDEATRAKIRKLTAEIDQAGQNFDRIMQEDVREIALTPADMAGLPADYVAAHLPAADGKVYITTDYPDYLPFMTYADNDTARMELRIAQRSRGWPENRAYVKTLLAKRFELAQLLGYESYADYAAADKMVQSPERVRRFLDDIARTIAPAVTTETGALLARAQKANPSATALQSWQYAYYAEQERRARYAVDARAVRSYLAFANVRQGLFDLASRLYGVTFRDWDAPVWAPGVAGYEIVRDGKPIGRFYLDLHPRRGKASGNTHIAIWPGLAGKQLPLSVLLCNFPGEADPNALMEHADLVVFLREFARMLHHQFAGNGEWVNNAGAATEWDFADSPAELFEEWAYDWGALKTFAVNVQGKTIPEELVRQLSRARSFGRAIETATQVYYAELSLAYHDRDPAAIDLDGVMRDTEMRFSPFALLPDTHFYANFAHLNGYASNYYGYLWSRAVAADLFSRFAKEGLLNPETGAAYRAAVLEPGGSLPAASLVSAFVGRPFSAEAYRAWLTKEE
ncbi:MAG: M3 family metallopeptidase [Alphaproteobacteria bacterium]